MRLWHQDLIKFLPRNQLLGQHRELCALRGMSFGKKHSTVDYVFNYPYYYLFKFHMLVIKEMKKRGYKVDPLWENHHYRGKNLLYDYSSFTDIKHCNKLIYKEHDDTYLKACLDNLKSKNIILSITKNSHFP